MEAFHAQDDPWSHPFPRLSEEAVYFAGVEIDDFLNNGIFNNNIFNPVDGAIGSPPPR